MMQRKLYAVCAHTRSPTNWMEASSNWLWSEENKRHVRECSACCRNLLLNRMFADLKRVVLFCLYHHPRCNMGICIRRDVTHPIAARIAQHALLLSALVCKKMIKIKECCRCRYNPFLCPRSNTNKYSNRQQTREFYLQHAFKQVGRHISLAYTHFIRNTAPHLCSLLHLRLQWCHRSIRNEVLQPSCIR